MTEFTLIERTSSLSERSEQWQMRLKLTHKKKYNKDAVSCGRRLKLFSTSVKKAMLSDISDISLTPGWRLGNVPRSGYFGADPGVYSCSYLN